LNYSEEAALGKEQEEALLFRAMQADIASQLVRRLAAVRLP
jgi:LPS-assembly lipoprotein